MAEKLGTLAGHFVIVPIANGETAESLSVAIDNLPALIKAAELIVDLINTPGVDKHYRNDDDIEMPVWRLRALREALSSIKGGK